MKHRIRRYAKKKKVEFTDRAKELASSYSFDWSSVRGSGKGGRITVKDVEAVLARQEEE